MNSGQPGKTVSDSEKGVFTITIVITWEEGGSEEGGRRPDAKILGSLDQEG